MGIILDLVLLSFFIISVWWGYRKGLIDVAFSLCAFIIAILATWILYMPITNLVLDKTEIDDNIKNIIVEKGIIQLNSEVQESDSEVSKYIKEYVAVPATDKANEAIESSAGIVSQKAVAIGVSIVLFIVIRVVLILLKFLADIIAKLPIIKQCDKAGGVVYGTIRGLFIVYAILAIMFFVMSVNNSGAIAETINSSIISKFLYSHNIILDIIF